MRFAPACSIFALLIASGCEASLIGDYGSRGNGANGAAGSNSSGGLTGTSPRWSANHPTQPTAPTTPTAPTQPTVTQGNNVVPANAGNANAVSNATPNANPPWANNGTAGGPTPVPTQTQCVQPTPVVDNTPRAMDPPGESCIRPCRTTWQQCFDRCNNGQDRGCVALCDEPYRDCARNCY